MLIKIVSEGQEEMFDFAKPYHACVHPHLSLCLPCTSMHANRSTVLF